MAEDTTPKKVVKRVVKRPIAGSKPAGDASTSAPSRPVMRYGRPVSEAPTKVAARDQPAPAPPTTPAGPTSVKPGQVEPGASAPEIKPRSKAGRKNKTKPVTDVSATVTGPKKVSVPRIDVGPMLASVRSRTSGAAASIGSGAGRARRGTGTFTAARWGAVRGWRIPHLAPVRATILTGLLVGLVSVGLGVGALRLFTEVRGVANGGPLWGSLAFVVVTIVGFALGERLLTGFGTALPSLTSFLGVMLTLITILSVFLGLADSRFGIAIVPVVAAAAFWASHWLLRLAESSPAEIE